MGEIFRKTHHSQIKTTFSKVFPLLLLLQLLLLLLKIRGNCNEWKTRDFTQILLSLCAVQRNSNAQSYLIINFCFFFSKYTYINIHKNSFLENCNSQYMTQSQCWYFLFKRGSSFSLKHFILYTCIHSVLQNRISSHSFFQGAADVYMNNGYIHM